jgi:hypothetical protein
MCWDEIGKHILPEVNRLFKQMHLAMTRILWNLKPFEFDLEINKFGHPAKLNRLTAFNPLRQLEKKNWHPPNFGQMPLPSWLCQLIF